MTDFYFCKDANNRLYPKHQDSIAFVKKMDVGEYVRFKLVTKNKRSLEQNAYLWGVVYKTILEQGGETLAGWTNSDIHEYLLGEHFGWQVIEGFGRKRMKPVNRSSALSKSEFMAFIDFIQQKMAELGIYIPNPNEEASCMDTDPRSPAP